MEGANQHDRERMVSDLENLTKVRRCFPTKNGCFSSQGNCVHDLNSFQGKSVKNHKFSFISTLIFKINQGMEIRLANICIQTKKKMPVLFK